MGVESLSGAAAGVAFAVRHQAESSSSLLGVILIAAAVKAFLRREGFGVARGRQPRTSTFAAVDQHL